MSTTSLYICKDISASLTQVAATSALPVNLSASKIIIELKAGGIPTVILVVDPHHMQGATNDLRSVTFSDLASVQSYLGSTFESGEVTGSISISITKAGDGEPAPEQVVTLNNWIVTGAGVHGVSVLGGFTLQFTLQHPAVLLDKTFANLGNVLNRDEYTKGTDPVNGLSEAYKAWAAVTRTDVKAAEGDSASSNASEMFARAKLELAKIPGLIDKHLKWETSWPGQPGTGYSNWPFENGALSSVSIDEVKDAINLYAADFAENSLWAVFAGTVMSEWSLTVIPTFWKEYLTVVPFSPWASPSMTIYSDQISHIEFPGMDETPIGGVKMALAVTAHPDSSYILVGAGEEFMDTIELVYLPPAVDTGGGIGGEYGAKPSIKGRILTFGMPSWLATTFSSRASNVPDPVTKEGDDKVLFLMPDNISEQDSINGPDSDATGVYDVEAVAQNTAALLAVCQQAYLTESRSSCEASFMTCLLLTGVDNSPFENGYLVPGVVARISERGAGALMDMYVTTIRHTLDAGSGQACSEIVGAWCRDSRTGSGVMNPIYGTPTAPSGGTEERWGTTLPGVQA